MSMSVQNLLSGPVFLLGVLSAGAAGAATVNRTELVMPAENCQAALPAYDGNIRKRPLAVQNEGTSPAFVTCAMKGTFGARAINSEVSITIANNTGTPISATCTLVDGRDLALSAPVYLTRTSTVSPALPSTFRWTTTDNGGSNYVYPAMSCSLQPGMAIIYTRRVYQYED